MEANRRDYTTVGFGKEKEDLEVGVEIQFKIESSICCLVHSPVLKKLKSQAVDTRA